jgi:hypothetical protein
MIKFRTSERNRRGENGISGPAGREVPSRGEPLFVHILRCGRITALALNEEIGEKKIKGEDGGKSITGKPRPLHR